MKKLLLTCLLFLPFLALPSPVHAGGPACKFEVGGYLRIHSGVCCAQAGPWYLYWPLEAHFNVPAPTGYPFWPNPMTLPGMAPSGPGGSVPPQMPLVPTEPLKPAGIHPVGYYYYPPPDYWYPR